MKAKWIVVAVLLAVVLAAGVGFGGYTLGVQAGTARAQALRNNFLAARGLGGQGQGGNGQGSGQFNANNFASGQVKSINGDTITLSTATTVVTIKLASGTQIQKMGPATPSDIQVGERITVQGTRGSDGSLAAESVQIGGGRGGAGAGSGAPAAAAPGQNSGTTN